MALLMNGEWKHFINSVIAYSTYHGQLYCRGWTPYLNLNSTGRHIKHTSSPSEHDVASCEFSMPSFDNSSCSKNRNHHLIFHFCPCERCCPPGTIPEIKCIKIMCSVHLHLWQKNSCKGLKLFQFFQMYWY